MVPAYVPIGGKSESFTVLADPPSSRGPWPYTSGESLARFCVRPGVRCEAAGDILW